MVVLGPVEELTIRGVHLVVVLRVLHVEVANPTEFAVDVTVFRKLRVIGLSSAFDIVFLIRVKLALWVQKHTLLILRVLIEVFLNIE